MLKNTTILAFAAGAASAASLVLMVASGPEHDPQANPQTNKVTPDEMNQMMEMSPEQMMAEMAKLATPGEHHKALGKSVGNWKAKASFIMDPSAPPQESEGSMSVKWVLGGRYIMSEFKLDFMGQPFEGLGYNGYDIAHQKYVGTWMDTMSTKITYMEGEMNGNDELVMHGTATTPMGDNPMKIVSKWIDKDTLQDKFFDQMPDGSWMNTGTITYTRQ